MKYLHAYWRVAYMDRAKALSADSPFLDVLSDGDERRSLLLWKTPFSFVVLNKYPYNAGHLLVLPRREVQDPEQLTAEELSDFFATIMRAKALIQRVLTPDGMNIGMNLGTAAGAGIPKHLHCHIVPRWEGDTNFMPVIGGVKVLPMALEELWEKLREFI